MSAQYIESHFSKFESVRHEKQGSVGLPPSLWFKKHGLKQAPDCLPTSMLTREEVFGACHDPKTSVLRGYVCVMAWGGQGSQWGGKRHVQDAWNNREKTAQILERLRTEYLSRSTAYDLFCGTAEVPGLGPAFFTKLLYFFRPDKDCYIMDKWTSQSVNLLTGQRIVRLAGSPSRANTGEDYERFCGIVDDLAMRLKTDGPTIEERLFSKGGRKNKKGDWRKYVVETYR